MIKCTFFFCFFFKILSHFHGKINYVNIFVSYMQTLWFLPPGLHFSFRVILVYKLNSDSGGLVFIKANCPICKYCDFYPLDSTSFLVNSTWISGGSVFIMCFLGVTFAFYHFGRNSSWIQGYVLYLYLSPVHTQL